MSEHVNPLMLEPVPGLEFFPGPHRYRKDGLWVPHSVTQVLGFDMSPSKREAIERTKGGPDGWEARGNACHKALDQYLGSMKLQNGHGVIYDDRWADWIDPLLDHPIFKGVEVLATEYAVYDAKKNCAGSFDFLLRVSPTSGEDNRVILGDLKSVSSKRALAARKPADAQLAAYQSMLASLHPSLLVTDLVTVVCGPGETRILNTDAESAWTHWEEAWGRYSVTLPSW